MGPGRYDDAAPRPFTAVLFYNGALALSGRRYYCNLSWWRIDRRTAALSRSHALSRLVSSSILHLYISLSRSLFLLVSVSVSLWLSSLHTLSDLASLSHVPAHAFSFHIALVLSLFNLLVFSVSFLSFSFVLSIYVQFQLPYSSNMPHRHRIPCSYPHLVIPHDSLVHMHGKFLRRLHPDLCVVVVVATVLKKVDEKINFEAHWCEYHDCILPQ